MASETEAAAVEACSLDDLPDELVLKILSYYPSKARRYLGSKQQSMSTSSCTKVHHFSTQK